jgi:hypothetical protein
MEDIIVTFESYGANGNGTFNNVTAWNAMVADHANIDVVTFDGVYNFDTTVNLPNVNGLILRGSGTSRATFFTDNLNNIISANTGTLNNFTLENIKFESTHTSTGQGNSNALFALADHTGANINFINCEFTAPNAVTNGFKLYAIVGNLYTDITFRDNYFHNLGRMAIETVNHPIEDLNGQRITRVIVENNIIEDTGLVIYGMGVSFSGRNDDCIIRYNTFNNNPTVAIELIGVENCDVYGNIVTGLGSPWHVVRLNIPGGTVTRPNNNVDIYDNFFNSTSGAVFIGGENVRSVNNYYAANSNMFVQNYRNLSFTNDTFLIFGFNASFNGGTPTAFIQMFSAATDYANDIAPNSGLSFTNSRLELTNNVPFFQSQDGLIPTVTRSEVYHPTSAGQYSANSTDVSIFVNGVFSSEVGDTGADYGVVGYTNTGNYGASGSGVVTPPTPPTTTTSGLQNILSIFFND